eukprot:TRINITY_DN49256_c0_g1_i1.p1 TRINITY_DN49256_c0_g1~~TRINITY_DN49256_c0_g1_i1.p1  ORF type:complete len:429 (-),score=61.88 TRINITY_DN49256_c0_g1_i1:521-1807(-)
MFGKWHLSNGRNNAFPTYASQQEEVRGAGFDVADGIYMENLAGDFEQTDAGVKFSHNMEWVTAKAVDFIQSVADDAPFFIYFNPTVPHAADVENALNDYECTKTPSGTLPAEPVLPGMTEGRTCAAYRATVLSRVSSSAQDRDKMLGSVWVDDALGSLLSTLEDKGILANTLILVMMDHGIASKAALFENGVRIAQFARYPPAIDAGAVFDGCVTNMDTSQSILSLAEQTPAFKLDGQAWISNTSMLSPDASDYWCQRCLFFEMEYDRAVKCGCYKLISVIGDSSESTTVTRAARLSYSTDSIQLYDVCNDPGEATNLASRHEHADVLSELQRHLLCHEARTAKSTSPADFSACDPAGGVASTAAATTSATFSSSSNEPPTTTSRDETTGSTTRDMAAAAASTSVHASALLMLVLSFCPCGCVPLMAY